MASPRLDAYHFYEEDWDSYEQLNEEFEWEIPDTFNIAEYVCDRWVDDRDRVAIVTDSGDSVDGKLTFPEVQATANRLANFLSESGVGASDRVGVSVGQRPEAALAHIACWKLGAVTVPLSTEFGGDALAYRLGDCDATACVIDGKSAAAFRSIRDDLDAMETVVAVGTDAEPSEAAWSEIDERSPEFETAETGPEDDAMIIYTSGTTGDPKGVLHGHQVLLGLLPRRAAIYLDSGPADRVEWTPVEWSWIGSLVAGVLPTLFYGQTVVAYDADRFDPETAFEIIERHRVTDIGGPTTILRMMMQVERPAERFDLGSMKQVGVGGEAVGESVVEWAEETFGAEIVEAYGQTEACHSIGDCPALREPRLEKMGVAFPGHEVAILDPETREPVGPGEVGEIAIRYDGNPVCFKEYVNKPERTARKVQDGWLLTEDLGTVDEDGYFAFEGRKDDVILTSGYRVSPEEIEETLASHGAVADAGVIGIPHDERGTVPKAFVVPADGERSGELKESLQTRVKERLAPYEYPREIEFVDELPKTSTGKVRRASLREREGLQ